MPLLPLHFRVDEQEAAIREKRISIAIMLFSKLLFVIEVEKGRFIAE